MDIKKYKTLVFDCDGVLLNSNKVKTQAFYRAAQQYGDNAAQSLVDYHLKHGGVSRYKKFKFFLENILCNSNPKEKELLQEVLDCHGLGPAFRSCFLHYYTYKRFFDDLLDFLEGICQSSEEAVKRDMLVGIRTDCFQWTYPLLPGLQ